MVDSSLHNAPTPPPAESYGAAEIQVLEGLEAVRKRPGMYIGSTGPTGLHHLVWEVVDNAVDEAMGGYCDRIDVTILADGGVQVVDNGRGIPVDLHSKFENLTAAEVVLTVLHAGGKFGDGGYKVSGGLHGVGVSVVNALSVKVEVEIDRGGQRHFMSFKNGGEPDQKLIVVGDAPLTPDGSGPRTGTTVRFWPDPTIFKEGTEFRTQTLLDRFQMMAFLNASLEFHCTRCPGPGVRRGGAALRRRHPGFRPPPERVEGGPVRTGGLPAGRGRGRVGGDRLLMEHRLPDRRYPQLRQRDQHHRGRDARAGLPLGPHPHRERLRAR